jgi:hypothetical protein
MKTIRKSLAQTFTAAAAAILLLGHALTASASTAAQPASPPTAPQVAATAPVMAPAAPMAEPIEDIRDIRPPFHIPPGWLWLAWAATGTALAALGYGLWRWRHRLPGLRPKLPFELALEQLEAARSLMQPEHAREFSIQVSEVVRNYIEVRFATHATHRTTEEFLHDCLAESGSTLAEHRDLLAQFLHHCDLAKFARWVLSVPEMEAMLQSASSFVRTTGTAPHATATLPAHSVRATAPTHLPSRARPDASDPDSTQSNAATSPVAAESSTLDPLPS